MNYTQSNNNQQSFNGDHVKSMKINKFMVIETGTYNDMWLRPYQTTVNQKAIEDLAHDMVARRHSVSNKVGYPDVNYSTIVPASIAKAATGIITPTAFKTERANIPNGWGERRVRFVLEVETVSTLGTTSIYFFQGYSDIPGITQSGYIADDMVFHINSMVCITRNQEYSSLGYRTVDRVVCSTQYLANHEYQGAYEIGQQYLMRPCDIYDGINTRHSLNELGKIDSNEWYNTTKVVNRTMKPSSRANNSSVDYMSKLLTSYQAGLQEVEYGQNRWSHLDFGASLVTEESPYSNPFLARLGHIQGQNYSTKFYYANLQNIDPYIVHNTNLTIKGPVDKAKSHYAGQTEHWEGADYPTLVATILANAVPSIMLDCLITSMTFRSTNNDIGGRITTIPVGFKSLTSADLTESVQRFIYKFDNEVIPHISYNNMELYSLHMSVDVFGDTRIDIQVGNNPMTTFTVPSFCDNLIAPVMTSEKDYYLHISNDIEQINMYLNSAISDIPNPPSNHTLQPI